MTDLLAGPKLWEGFATWLYLDSLGKVTTGIGLYLRTPEDAMTLPWRTATGDAGPDDVREQYQRVAGAPHGWTAQHYQELTTIRLTADAVLARAEALMDDTYLPGLRRIFVEFDHYPEPAQEALADMIWNVGPHGLAQFSHLRESCDAARWDGAAEACHVVGVRTERHLWRQDRFRAAMGPGVA